MQPYVITKTPLYIRVNLYPIQPSQTMPSWYMNLEWGQLGLIGLLTPLESNSEVDLTFHYILFVSILNCDLFEVLDS